MFYLGRRKTKVGYAFLLSHDSLLGQSWYRLSSSPQCQNTMETRKIFQGVHDQKYFIFGQWTMLKQNDFDK